MEREGVMGRILRSLGVIFYLGIMIFAVDCTKKRESVEPAAPVAAVSGELHVAFFSPQGQTQEPHEAETIVVIFDRPIIPLQMLGDEPGPELIKFEPKVQGKYRWLNPKTLTFSPEKRFSYAAEIQAVIPAGIQSFEGCRLEQDFRWTFRTVQPRLLQHFPREKQEWLDTDTEVLLIFNIPMSPKKAKGFISLTAMDAKNREAALEFEIEAPSKKDLEQNEIEAAPDTVLMIMPREKLKPENRYFVQIRAGLPAEEGHLGTVESRIIEFSTYKKFAFSGFTAGKPHDPGAELEFRFTNPVAYKDFVKNIRLEPEVTIPEYYSDWDQTDDRLWISLSLKPESDYVLRIGSGLKDRFGNSLDKEEKLEFQTSAYPARIDMTTGIGIVESHSDLRYPVYAINSRAVDIKAGKVTNENVIPVLNTKQVFWQKIPLVRKNFFRTEETMPLNRKHNVREIFPIGLENVLENKTGVVFLQLDTHAEDEWSRYLKAMLLVTDLGISAKYSPDNNIIWVTSLKEGVPVAGADVEIRGDDNKVQWRGRTDGQGKVETPGWKPLGIRSLSKWDKPRQWVFVRKENDFAFASSEWGTGVYPYRLGIPYDWDPKPETFRGYLFTERGIYRAGETVHIKGLFREKAEGRWMIPSSEEVLCEIRDPFNKVLLNEKHKLDEFGSFSLDFETEEEASLGNYQISAATGPFEETDKPEKTYGSFRVEAFRPAEFEVHLRSHEEGYVFGDDYRAELHANYLFGGAMGMQNLSWSLRLNPASYAPPGFKEYIFGNKADYWDRTDPQESRLILSGEGKLDKDGIHPLETKLVPEEETDSALAALEVTVQGPSRRSVSNRIQTLVHRGEFYVGMKPESRFLKKGEELRTNILTVDPSGKVIPGRNVKLALVQREW
ncbi:MAG: hypothetical protein JXB23_00775, partial [Candidatus Aminicenantes bacterium]|nr:hypothetical protein [Candidatus Aminicenantes bacterium]